jgi:hypothetical protein
MCNCNRSTTVARRHAPARPRTFWWVVDSGGAPVGRPFTTEAAARRKAETLGEGFTVDERPR